MKHIFLLLVTILVGALGGSATAQVATLQVSNHGETRLYTLEDLRGMPSVEFATTTLWTEGVIVFTGVPLSQLVGDVPEGSVVRATALNDYVVDIPVSALGREYPVVAYLRNGTPFPIRDKGPFWIVYPYDADPIYRSDEIFAYSVWQLHAISIENSNS